MQKNSYIDDWISIWSERVCFGNKMNGLNSPFLVCCKKSNNILLKYCKTIGNQKPETRALESARTFDDRLGAVSSMLNSLQNDYHRLVAKHKKDGAWLQQFREQIDQADKDLDQIFSKNAKE